MKNLLIITILTALTVSNGLSQSFDLPKALKEKKLVVYHEENVSVSDESRRALSMTGVFWLKDFTFSEGTIEVDLKGNNIPQGTFLGIAFHAIDTITFDCIYFRPFNFRSADPVKKIHAVQYVSAPKYGWDYLRENNNGIYEKAVTPAPDANEWFHAKIVVKGKEINVYVNRSETPSLTVTKLNDRNTGLLGLFNEGKNGDFANLVIKKTK